MYKLAMLKVAVSNLNQSVQFYQEALGFELVFVAEEYGWAQLKSGDIDFALYVPGLGGGEKQLGGSTDFHLMLDESKFEVLSKQLLASGHLSENMIHTGNDGTTFIDVLDPDHNIIKMFRH